MALLAIPLSTLVPQSACDYIPGVHISFQVALFLSSQTS
jgi:hypothetical protein